MAARLYVARDAAAFRAKLAGPAVTVMLKESTNSAAASQGMLDAIDPARLDLRDGTREWRRLRRYWRFDGQGDEVPRLAGAVIDGSVRDTPQIRKLQFPVFSRGVVPSTTINHFRVIGTNIPVACAGVRVNPSDIVTTGEDGAAVAPRACRGRAQESARISSAGLRLIPRLNSLESLPAARARRK